MGYILPLNHEQYTQYANRTTRKDAPPFTLVPVQNLNIRTKLKGKTNYEEKREKVKLLYNNNDNEDDTVKVIDPTLIDYYVADLTGKGTLFNEVV